MTYNIHPLLVHFPIAFFLLYSLFKILPFKKWFPKISWNQINLILLIGGVLGAFSANITGEVAEHLVNPNHQIVEIHSLLAVTSTWIYALLLVGELFFVINPLILKVSPPKIVLLVLNKIESLLTNKLVIILLATLGLLAISITGLLGGVMVYGVSADPVAPFILKLLGIQL